MTDSASCPPPPVQEDPKPKKRLYQVWSGRNVSNSNYLWIFYVFTLLISLILSLYLFSIAIMHY